MIKDNEIKITEESKVPKKFLGVVFISYNTEEGFHFFFFVMKKKLFIFFIIFSS